MKNKKTLLAVLAGLALSSCTTRVATENDASLKGVLGDKFFGRCGIECSSIFRCGYCGS